MGGKPRNETRSEPGAEPGESEKVEPENFSHDSPHWLTEWNSEESPSGRRTESKSLNVTDKCCFLCSVSANCSYSQKGPHWRNTNLKKTKSLYESPAQEPQSVRASPGTPESCGFDPQSIKYKERPSKDRFIKKLCVFILMCLNFSHLQSTLRLMQYT